MKKIYFIIAGALLIILVIISMLLSLGKKTTENTQNNSPFPTSVPTDQSSTNNSTGSTDLTNSTDSTNLDISTIAPVETEDFKLQYSEKINRVVIEKKTAQAEEKFIDWAGKNNESRLIKNPELVHIINSGQNPDNFNPVIDFFSIFMGQGIRSSSEDQPIPTPIKSSSNLAQASTTSTSNSTPSSFTYFPQCGDLGNISLPNGCNLCEAGCGPTAVSMIATSYLGGGHDPKAIVEIYKNKGYLLGCDGSRYSDAKQVLQGLGLKTTDYIVFNEEKSDTVVPDLRKYLSAGWTFFTLASFCDGGCGHYFWITDIDSRGNIFAYDPAYGRFEIPYNENTRYPYPLYRLAFGVKR